jgi:hypothetical protein
MVSCAGDGIHPRYYAIRLDACQVRGRLLLSSHGKAFFLFPLVVARLIGRPSYCLKQSRSEVSSGFVVISDLPRAH